jgi:hypothetical protein
VDGERAACRLRSSAAAPLDLPIRLLHPPARPRAHWHARAGAATQGALCDTFSFSVLTGVFVDGEPHASLACAVSAAGAAALLLSFQQQGLLPAALGGGAVAVLGVALGLSGGRALGALSSAPAAALWAAWQDFLGVVGSALLCQATWAAAMAPGVAQQAGQALVGGLPACLGVAAALLWRRRWRQRPQQPPSWVVGLWPDVPAWTATLLLISQPLVQLVSGSHAAI